MIYLMILLPVIIIQFLPDFKIHMQVRTKSVVLSKPSVLMILLSMEIMVITCFRKYTVGTDLHMYTKIFEVIGGYSWKNLLYSKFEPGYMIYTWLIRCFSANIQIFIAVTGMITVAFYLLEIHFNSHNPFIVVYLSLTYGFFFFQFSILRQAIAISLFMIGINKLAEKKWFAYVGIILIASAFHTSAIICLPLVFVVLLPWTDFVLKAVWGIEIVVLISLRGILEMFVPYVSRYAYVLNETTSYMLGYMVRIVIICGLYLASVFFCKVGRNGKKLVVKKGDGQKDNFILILGSIGMTLMLMINYFESVQRMTYYFMPYVFWSVDLATYKSRWMRRMLPCIYILLGIYYLFCFTGFTSVNDAFGTSKYLFFWQ